MLGFARVLKYRPDQAREPAGSPKGGQFTFSQGKVSQFNDLVKRLSQPDGGFTYHVVTGREPKTGYAVSPYPDRSFAKDAKDFLPDDYARYVKKNRDVLRRADHYVGGWHDPASGRVFLDVSVVSKTAAKAEELSRKHDQIAYFDLEKGQSVTVNSKATSGGVVKGVSDGKGRASKAGDARGWRRYFSGGCSEGVRKADEPQADPGGSGKDEKNLGRGRLSLAQIFKYSPTQPRAPKGSSIGGQFVEKPITWSTPATELYKKHDNEANEQTVLGRLSEEDRKAMADAAKDINQRILVNKEHTKLLHARDKSKVRVDKFTAHGNRFNYTKERLELQNKFIKAVLAGKEWDEGKGEFVERKGFNPYPDKGQKPTMMMLGGRGGSGKSTFAISEAERRGASNGMYDANRFAVLDADAFKTMLAKADGHDRIGNLAAVYHDESSDMFSRAVQMAKRQGMNIVLDQTLKSEKSAVLKRFKDKGYRTELHYLHYPREDAAVSAFNRFKTSKGNYSGRWVPAGIILGNTKNEANFDAMKDKADSWTLWTRAPGEVGEKGQPKLVASSEGWKSPMPKKKAFVEILKFNPYHDEKGRFSSYLRANFVSLWGKEYASKALDKLRSTMETMKSDWKNNGKDLGLHGYSVLMDKYKNLLDSVPRSTTLQGMGFNNALKVIGKYKEKLDAEAAKEKKDAEFLAQQKEKATLAWNQLMASGKIPKTYATEELLQRDYAVEPYRGTLGALGHDALVNGMSYKSATKRAMSRYVGGGYKGTNKMLNGVPGWENDSDGKFVDKYLSGVMKKTVVGMDVEANRAMAAVNFFNSMGLPGGSAKDLTPELVGKVYTEKGYSSTTLKSGVGYTVGSTASKAHQQMHLRIKVPKEAKGIYFGNNINQDENELTLNKNTKFLITGIGKHVESGVPIVDAVVLP